MEEVKNKFLAGVSLLIAITVVLQTISVILLKVAGFGFNLVIIPIIIAGIFYGLKGGTVVGAVFGLTAFLHCVLGWDAGGAVFFAESWLLTLLLTFGRGTVIGFTAALLYKGIKKSTESSVNPSIVVSLITPILNTGIFVAVAYSIFYSVLETWAAGENADNVLKWLLGVISLNFIFEVASTLILCPSIVRALEKANNK